MELLASKDRKTLLLSIVWEQEAGVLSVVVRLCRRNGFVSSIGKPSAGRQPKVAQSKPLASPKPKGCSLNAVQIYRKGSEIETRCGANFLFSSFLPNIRGFDAQTVFYSKYLNLNLNVQEIATISRHYYLSTREFFQELRS